MLEWYLLHMSSQLFKDASPKFIFLFASCVDISVCLFWSKAHYQNEMPNSWGKTGRCESSQFLHFSKSMFSSETPLFYLITTSFKPPCFISHLSNSILIMGFYPSIEKLLPICRIHRRVHRWYAQEIALLVQIVMRLVKFF